MVTKGVRLIGGKGKKYQILAGKGAMSARLVSVVVGLTQAKATAAKYHEKHPNVYVGVVEMKRLRVFKPSKR